MSEGVPWAEQGRLDLGGAAVLWLRTRTTGLLPRELMSIRKKQEHHHPFLPLTGITQVMCQKDRAQASNKSFRLR